MPQIRYISLLGVEYRSLRYIRPSQDLSPDIRHKTPSVKSSAIYLADAIHLLPVETHTSLLDIRLGYSELMTCRSKHSASLFRLVLLSYSYQPIVSLPSCLQSSGTLFSSRQRVQVTPSPQVALLCVRKWRNVV